MTDRVTTPRPALPIRPGILPFAIAITVLNILGHTWLGFEQAFATPFVSLAGAYFAELAIELAINGWGGARFRGGLRNLVVFLLPAHITGLAVGMLLYTNERFMVVAFASSLAIFSKVFFRVPTGAVAGPPTTHFLNPSNFGIAVTLLIFHDWVGVVQPYQFTENVYGVWDWVLPAIVICSGSFLNWRATKKIPLILAWLSGFVLQACVRSMLSEQSTIAYLAPMTGFAFILFTFYMVTDPMTSPRDPKRQILFGAGTAAVYGLLSHAGVVFGLFFALTIVCAIRGLLLWAEARGMGWSQVRAGVPAKPSAIKG